MFLDISRFSLMILCLSLVACTQKNYYQDATGRYYYRGNNGVYYYQDKQGGAYHGVNSPKEVSTNSDLLADKVAHALQADPRTSNLSITVRSLNDQIILGGYVDHNEQRLRAIEIARSIPGVKLVVSKISIKLL